MYSYVTEEVPELLNENFPQLDITRASIFGHSMGGHGALTIFLKNSDKYKVIDKTQLRFLGWIHLWSKTQHLVFCFSLFQHLLQFVIQ